LLFRYHLRFRVYDRKHTQTDVPANVTITVREVTHEAILNSGSIRIAGITDEDFIRIWDYRTQDVVRSKIDKLRDKLSQLLGTDVENIDIFSVQLRQQRPPITDVRFSAHGSPYYKPIKLNGIVLQHREEVTHLDISHIFRSSSNFGTIFHSFLDKFWNNLQIEAEVGINITMVGINECLVENLACEGSCTNVMEVSTLPYLVNANKTALVGVRVDIQPECTCGSRNFSRDESCRSNPCHNGGRCIEGNGRLCATCSKT